MSCKKQDFSSQGLWVGGKDYNGGVQGLTFAYFLVNNHLKLRIVLLSSKSPGIYDVYMCLYVLRRTFSNLLCSSHVK